MAKQWKSEKEISDAINAIQHRISVLRAESVAADILAGLVNVAVLESGFKSTVRETFGADSSEFEEFGALQMHQGPLRIGMSHSEISLARMRGLNHMVDVCVELIDRLQQKLQTLRHKSEANNLPPLAADEMHPAISRATQLLTLNGHYWEAVFAASKALVLHVKTRSGRQDLDGVPLMRLVFSKNKPILKFNDQRTQSDLDEQEGMMHLFEGAVMAIRNPGGHAFPTGTELRAIQYIHFLSLLAFMADDATV